MPRRTLSCATLRTVEAVIHSFCCGGLPIAQLAAKDSILQGSKFELLIQDEFSQLTKAVSVSARWGHQVLSVRCPIKPAP
jgi:hypothetical protein